MWSSQSKMGEIKSNKIFDPNTWERVTVVKRIWLDLNVVCLEPKSWCLVCLEQDLAILSFPDDEESDEEAVKKTNKCVLVWEVGDTLLNTEAEFELIP